VIGEKQQEIQDAGQLFASVFLEGLYPLIERRYERDRVLVDRGWHAFTVPLQKQKDWIAPEDIELHRAQTTDSEKRTVSRMWNLEREWLSQYQMRNIAPPSLRERSLVWKKILELQDAAYSTGKPDAYLYPAYLEMKRCRTDEIRTHVQGVWKKYNPERRTSLRKLLAEVSAECGASLGYAYDQELTTSDRLVLSKPANDSWRYCLCLLGEFKRYQPPSKPRGEVAWFQELYPDVRLHFAISRIPPVYSPMYQPRVMLTSLFPVQEPPLFRFCHEFDTLEEMELVIRFNFAMAGIIQTGLEPLFEKAIEIIQ